MCIATYRDQCMYCERDWAIIQLVETVFHRRCVGAWQSKGEKPSIKLSRPKTLCKGGTNVRVPSPEPGVGLQMASMLSMMHKLVLGRCLGAMLDNRLDLSSVRHTTLHVTYLRHITILQKHQSPMHQQRHQYNAKPNPRRTKPLQDATMLANTILNIYTQNTSNILLCCKIQSPEHKKRIRPGKMQSPMHKTRFPKHPTQQNAIPNAFPAAKHNPQTPKGDPARD